MGKGSELDKQINKEGSNTWGCPEGWLDVEDVKEFIKELKKEILKVGSGAEDHAINLSINRDIIDKLAGEKLI